jgi:hypothetical protein
MCLLGTFSAGRNSLKRIEIIENSKETTEDTEVTEKPFPTKLCVYRVFGGLKFI